MIAIAVVSEQDTPADTLQLASQLHSLRLANHHAVMVNNGAVWLLGRRAFTFLDTAQRTGMI